MSRLAYYRVSTVDQSVDTQRVALGGNFDREFVRASADRCWRPIAPASLSS